MLSVNYSLYKNIQTQALCQLMFIKEYPNPCSLSTNVYKRISKPMLSVNYSLE